MIDIGFGIIRMDLGTLLLIIGIVTIFLDFLLVIFGSQFEKWEIYSEFFLSIGTISVIIAFLYFAYSVLIGDYSFFYVYGYVNEDMDLFMRISALWSGQAGSFFFWTFVAALAYAIFRYMFRQYAHEAFFWRSFVLFAVQITVLIGLTLLNDPFKIYEEIVSDGIGLNPNLLNFWNMIHPPIIFLGYVLCLIPTVIGLVKISLLENGKVPDFEGKEQLNKFLEFIVSFAWLILSSGIIIGGYWAYITLGWGGFWGWDPVETGSLIPWLFLTLYHHGRSFHRKSEYLANFILSMTYTGTLLATYLTRSGIITSVHAYEPGGTLEKFLNLFIPGNSFLMSSILRIIPSERLILLFILLMGAFLAPFIFGIKNREIFRIPLTLRQDDFQISKSRTTALKISYISLLSGTFFITIGLIGPAIYDVIGYLITFSSTGFGPSITIGKVYYNTVLTVFGGIMLLAQFFCTFYPRMEFKKKFGLMIGGLTAGIAFAVSGILYRSGYLSSLLGEENLIITIFRNFWTISDKANLVLPLLILGIIGLAAEFIKISLTEEKNLIRKTSQTMLHISFLVILLGSVTSVNMTISNNIVVQARQEYPIPGTSLTLYIQRLHEEWPLSGPHLVEYDTEFRVSSGSRVVGYGISRVAVHRRWANTASGTFREVTIIGDLFADIYIVTYNPLFNPVSGGFEAAEIQIRIIPYINILWVGCIFLHFAIIPLTIGRFIQVKEAFSEREKENDKIDPKNDISEKENTGNGENTNG